MAAAKSDLNFDGFVLYPLTVESVETPLKSCWSSGAKLLSPDPLALGQLPFLDWAKDESMFDSLYILALKLVQRACPIVCEPENGDVLSRPDKTTMSLVERPTALKLEMRRLRLEVGGGMLLLAAAWLAVLASLLPIESREAMAKMSAHDTTPGQTFSTADLIWSMTSNPRADWKLGAALFSPVKEDFELVEKEEITLTKQSWKKRRRREAPMRASFWIADRTTELTVWKSFGHDFE
nr:hypothetical protein CR513_47686 [Ipomoea batatas]